jgi:hypothetical protein
MEAHQRGPRPVQGLPPGGSTAGAVAFFGRGQQVEQQGGEPGVLQDLGDIPIALAVPAASAAVREHHNAPRMLGNGQVTGHRHRPGEHPNFLIAQRRVGGVDRNSLCKAVPGAIEERDHLVVGGLGEVAVTLPHREEVRRRLQTHDLVGVPGEPRDDIVRPIGTASTTLLLAPCARATWHAALVVAPVAMPSSTITAIRPVNEILISEAQSRSAGCGHVALEGAPTPMP